MILLKTSKEIDYIRKSCSIVAYVLSKIEKEIKPGITTNYLNDIAEELCYEKKGIPGFKGYKGFPFSICASKNDKVVHGFPDDISLVSGDILSIDFGVLYNGWYGDSAITVPVGKVTKEINNLINVGYKCLDIGISKAKPYCRIGDISNAIQEHAENNGFNVIKEFVGHGIGKNLHEDPMIPNFGKINTGYILKPGTVIAIEPIIVMGSNKIHTLKDNWTTKTIDGSLAVHTEHTVAITKYGTEILTNRD